MRSPPQFDKLARAYRWMELFTFGPWLMLTRCTFLPRLGESRRALVIGDGDGRFTAKLLKSNSAVAVDAVDASGAMLRELLRRAGAHSNRVHTHGADARTWMETDAKVGYDLVVTHFFLDCLADAEVLALARQVLVRMAPSAIWILSEFGLPEGRLAGAMGRGVIGILYWAFGWLTGLSVQRLPDYGGALRTSGFDRMERKERLGGLLVAELWVKRTLPQVCGS